VEISLWQKLDEFDAWLDERGFTAANPPDEVWIGATMSYWWESARDLVGRLRRRWGQIADSPRG
jgi:hypothetical protein